MNFSDFLRDTQNRKAVFFTGKGGVGKTTLVWATAAALRAQGRRVAVAGWDPYREPEAARSPMPSIDADWVHLDTLGAFREYSLKVVRFEKLYDAVFDNAILRTFLLATPGLSDTVIAGKVMDLARDGYDHVLVDLPSSGHTLRFFRSPVGVHRLFPFGFVHRETLEIDDFFRAPTTRIDVVTLAETMPLQETDDLITELKTAGLATGWLHFNQVLPDFSPAETADLTDAAARTQLGDFVADAAAERERTAQFRPSAGLACPRLAWPRLATETRASTVEGLLRAMDVGDQP